MGISGSGSRDRIMQGDADMIAEQVRNGRQANESAEATIRRGRELIARSNAHLRSSQAALERVRTRRDFLQGKQSQRQPATVEP